MAERRALLIGVADYGEGFEPLPAVLNDLALMEKALTARGFTPRRVDAEALGNAALLAKSILEFCKECQAGDIHIVYFTGHGLSVDGEDWIVPAGVSRDDAESLQNLRVPTDYSRVVAKESTGQVLFLIDACRSPEFAGSAWGKGKRDLTNPRFIRFLGCGSEQACYVLAKGHEGKDISVFSKALADALTTGWETTLLSVLEAAKNGCRRLREANPGELPDLQEPRLDLGEIKDGQVAERLIFPRREVAVALREEGRWPEGPFEPSRFHCLVVSSEQEPFYPGKPQRLERTVHRALIADNGERVWNSFRGYWTDRMLVGGKRRPLPRTYHKDQIVEAHRPLLYLLESAERLELAARALTEADVVVFDVTGFEPGVMLLMGIRSAARRGVSISSHGGGWQEGTPLAIPFGLHDLNLNCHTVTKGPGHMATIDRLVDRICEGFEQLDQQPDYLDLPAYNSLRQMGSEYAESGTVGLRTSKPKDPADKERPGMVLVLCSYEGHYSEHNWVQLETSVTDAVEEHSDARPRVQRMIDLATPRLISQSLFELLRRVEACLVDWTDYKGAVFLELGVRLAASPWGAVQIAEKRSLPGGLDVPCWSPPRAAAGQDEKCDESVELIQIRLLQEVFEPIAYQLGEEEPFQEVARQFETRDPYQDETPLYSRVYQAIVGAVGRVAEQAPPVHTVLAAAADALQHPTQGQISAPQVLFHGNPALKKDGEQAALERRLAAWLYLHHRLGASAKGHPLRKLWMDLGTTVEGGLYDADGENDFDLAEEISELLERARKEEPEGKD